MLERPPEVNEMPVESKIKIAAQYPAMYSQDSPTETLAKRLTAPFRRSGGPPTTVWKSDTVSAIWGFDQGAGESSLKWSNRLERLETYFDDFEVLLLDGYSRSPAIQSPSTNGEGGSASKYNVEDAAARCRNKPVSLGQRDSQYQRQHASIEGAVDDGYLGETGGSRWYLHQQLAHVLKYTHLLRLNPGVPGKK